MYRMYIAMMELFQRICFGRNSMSCDFLLQNSHFTSVGYFDLMRVASMESLPYPARASALELLNTLYIDREPRQRNSPVQLLHCWPGISAARTRSGIQQVDPFSSYPERLRPTPWFDDLKVSVLTSMVEICCDSLASEKVSEAEKFSLVDEEVTPHEGIFAENLADSRFVQRVPALQVLHRDDPLPVSSPSLYRRCSTSRVHSSSARRTSS